MNATFKFNGGKGALICSSCSTIIKVGKQFNSIEIEAMRGKAHLPPQFCETCKKKMQSE